MAPQFEEKKRILIIDDDPTIRSSIQMILSRHNYLVAGAKSASEAMELVVGSLKNGKSPYDLILLDLNLRSSSGFDFLKELRENYNLQIPVLIISGMSESDNIYQAAKYQIKGFIVKPFTSAVLEEKIRICLYGK